MFVVIAQGGGYYGAAFFTSELDRVDMALALDRVGWGFKSVKNAAGVASGDFYCSIPPDSGVTVNGGWAGQPQPNPVVLFDSGHDTIDMHVLCGLVGRLKKPTPEVTAARFVEKPGWRAWAATLGLSEADCEEIIKRSAAGPHPARHVADG